MLLEKQKRIGMRDIAEAAGVSVTVVSSALSGSGRVSDIRKQEIIQLAQRMGYRTNAAARLLKSKKVEDIGLLIFEHDELVRENAGFMDMTIQFQKECLRNNLHFQLEWFDCYKNSDSLPQILVNGLVGGMLIAGVPANASKKYIENELTLPYVSLCETSAYSVCYDQQESLRQAIYYLTSLGHNNIGLINGPSQLKMFRDYKKIFMDTLQEISQADAVPLYLELNPVADMQQEIMTILDAYAAQTAPPTALLVQSGLFVKSLICGMFQRGLRVPDDVSIICFETVDWEVEKFHPPVTALEHRFNDIIVTGIEMLGDLMNGRKIQSSNRTILPLFTKRNTVAKRSLKI